MNKWGLGLVVFLALGLTGCDWMTESTPDPVDYSAAQQPMGERVGAADANQGKPVQKSYASKDPVQKTTPGPKRAAAPQMPVLQ